MIDLIPDILPESEVARHTQDCVENWRKTLPAEEFAELETRLRDQFNQTVTQAAEILVRTWFNQKVRVI
jgi:hypothetical protein